MIEDLPAEVTEGGLDAFRAAWLGPTAILRMLATHPRLLVSVAVGIGKSFAVDQLLLAPETYSTYDLVVYLAPSTAILDERPVLNGTATPPVPWLRLSPRPAARCGPLDPEWKALERAGCTPYAKASLCKTCPHYAGADPCDWPRRLVAGLGGAKLVLGAEQHLTTNPNLLLLLKSLAKAERVLLILDEAKSLDAPREVTLYPADLDALVAVLAKAAVVEPKLGSLAHRWRASLRILRATSADTVTDEGWDFPSALHRYAAVIQEQGLALIGPGFRYAGYDVQLFAGSHPDERWRDESGGIRFVARPYLGADLLLLSAHMKSGYVTGRLALAAPIPSPFEAVRFLHTGTKAYNLKSLVGAERYFKKNSKQILDFVATLIRRNIIGGRSTVLVSRKRFKDLCAVELGRRLAGWGFIVQFATTTTAAHAVPDPHVVPVLHYGERGINTYALYDAAYCLNSYYIAPNVLSQALQEHAPRAYRVPLEITLDDNRVRRVGVTDPAHAHSGLDRLGDDFLHKLEIEPVLQATGRVRFYTRPREVLFFQLANMTPDVPGLVEFHSIEAARAGLGVPRARELDIAYGVARLHAVLDSGGSLREAARQAGLDKETARRWLARMCLKEADTITNRGVEPRMGDDVA